ncbi:MAG: CHAT domain-containing protein [candidate division Zixibacteria bacterium]|nr:CHAT domain-containing protein [candidate division Zixibacteria bacterium]
MRLLLFVLIIISILCCQQTEAQNQQELLRKADFLYDLDNIDSAIVLGNLALEQAESGYDRTDIEIVSILECLSKYHYKKREFIKSKKFCKQALKIKQNVTDPKIVDIAKTLYKLALINVDLGQFGEAESYAVSSLAIREKYLGTEHPLIANDLNILGIIYKNQNKYSQAESKFVRALDICENTYGATSLEAAFNLSDLGNLYDVQGNYAESELAHKRSLAIRKSRLGSIHPDVGNSLNNLAVLYFKQGKYIEADSLFMQALTIIVNTLGGDHPSVAKIMCDLASSKVVQSEYSDAEQYFFKALNVFERLNGSEHLTVADVLNRIGHLYTKQGRYAEAEPLIQKALTIKQKVYGPEHKQTAFGLHRLGNLYYSQGKYIIAEPFYMQAITINERVLTSLHPIVIEMRANLAKLYACTGKYSISMENYKKSLRARQKFMEYVFTSSSESQKLRWIKKYPLIDNSFLSLALLNKDENIVHEAFNMVLQGKSSVIDAVMAEKEAAFCSSNQKVIDKLKERSDIYTKIANIALRSFSGNLNGIFRDSIQVLYNIQDSLETELGQLCLEFNKNLIVKRLDISEVAQSLSEDVVLWEYVRYDPYDFSIPGNDIERVGNARYLAFILVHSGKIDIIDLGEAHKIDSLISFSRKTIYNSQEDVYSTQIIESEECLKSINRNLYSLLFAPLASHLDGQTNIYISPDGMLNLLPFEILPTPDDTYVIEKYGISYLSSVRDLAMFDRGLSIHARDALVLADPDFDESILGVLSIDKEDTPKTSSVTIGEQFRDLPDCFSEEFARLRFSRKEANSIVKSIRKNSSMDVNEYYGTYANEEVLKSIITPPKILHLSTHGFICEDIIGGDNSAIKNPLLKSGLILAGANRIMNFDEGNLPQGEDGILTAFEVSGLNLVGTELATLSACETGVGELVHGEGVFSLRRAFQHAGVRSILMSLWKVPDKQTAELMEEFYKQWLGGMSKRDALRESALGIIKRSRAEKGSAHPLLWGGFVLTGKPD